MEVQTCHNIKAQTYNWRLEKCGDPGRVANGTIYEAYNKKPTVAETGDTYKGTRCTLNGRSAL